MEAAMTVLMWPERLIRSLYEFHEIVGKIGAQWPNADRCLFRGQAQSPWTLLPTLPRETPANKCGWQEIIRLEQELAHQFRQEAHRTLPQAVLPRQDYILDWWPLMQHYGAPTRLLDWTLSPYVALYFAVDRHWEEDGAVWWFKAATAENLMLRRFPDFLSRVNALFHPRDADDPFVDPPPILISFELKRTVDRIGNQQGFFTLCLDASEDHVKVLAELAQYAYGPHCEKIIVPKELKPEFLRELHLMNVTGKSLFPGLDGLGRTMTEISRLSGHFGPPPIRR
jgi:hypothetical protein